MSWPSGVPQNNPWYGSPPYANYAAYGCPPPPPPPPPGQVFPSAPPPVPPPGWAGYPPYGAYPFPQNWTYPVSPSVTGNFVATADPSNSSTETTETTTTATATATTAATASTAITTNTTADLSKINPPLPPDPPPEKPSQEANKQDKKENISKDDKADSSNDTKSETPVKSEDANKTATPVTPVPPAFAFDPRQFTVPPPTCYPMYPPNPWFNPGYPNIAYPPPPNTIDNQSNSNSTQSNVNAVQSPSEPIRFSILKKGNMVANLQQSQTAEDQKECINYNYYQANSLTTNDTSSSSSPDNSSHKNKKKRKNEDNDVQPWNKISDNDKKGWNKSGDNVKQTWNKTGENDKHSWNKAGESDKHSWNKAGENDKQPWKSRDSDKQSWRSKDSDKQSWKSYKDFDKQSWNKDDDVSRQMWSKATGTEKPSWNKGGDNSKQSWSKGSDSDKQSWNKQPWNKTSDDKHPWKSSNNSDAQSWNKANDNDKQPWSKTNDSDKTTSANKQAWNKTNDTDRQPWKQNSSYSVNNFNANSTSDTTKSTASPQTTAPPKTPKRDSSAIISSGDWPETLKRYVERCFARCVTELDKDQVEICLKGKLTLAARNESLWTKNWDEEPLISIHSVQTASPEKKEKAPSSIAGRLNKKFEGDPSRGFTVVRRSRSRSRSRSSSPYSADGRRRRDKRHHSSSESEDRTTGFIGFSSRPGRGRGGQRGRGNKRRGRDRLTGGDNYKGNENYKGNNYKENENYKGNENEEGDDNSYFYSKSGVMALDADLCTDEKLQKRAARFANAQRGGRGGGRGGGAGAGAGAGAGGTGQGNQKQKRKSQALNLSTTINNAFTVDGDNIDWTSIHCVGTSTALEKQYLRLTSAPDPSTIRTVATLKKSLEHVKKMWVTNKDYFYTCNQLKSIRQDLTVQGIRDEFTMEVYETHCRIALEKCDHEEFNQCQTQLKELYADHGGTNRLEFASYRLLYYIFTKNTLDITSILASFTESEKQNKCVSFALKLRAAWSLCNYHQFFKLYQNAPLMAGFLIDWFAKRERERAIKILIKSYRPGNLCAEFVRSTLALRGEEDWESFVDEFKICFTDKTKKLIDCKKTAVIVVG